MFHWTPNITFHNHDLSNDPHGKQEARYLLASAGGDIEFLSFSELLSRISLLLCVFTLLCPSVQVELDFLSWFWFSSGELGQLSELELCLSLWLERLKCFSVDCLRSGSWPLCCPIIPAASGALGHGWFTWTSDGIWLGQKVCPNLDFLWSWGWFVDSSDSIRLICKVWTCSLDSSCLKTKLWTGFRGMKSGSLGTKGLLCSASSWLNSWGSKLWWSDSIPLWCGSVGSVGLVLALKGCLCMGEGLECKEDSSSGSQFPKKQGPPPGCWRKPTNITPCSATSWICRGNTNTHTHTPNV